MRGAFLFALMLCACSPDSGPVTVRVFGLDPATSRYGFFDARLETLHDVTEMRGDTVRMVGNATVVADALAAATDAKSTEVLRAEGGEAPACSFIDRDGVLHAEDYDSLIMASSYYALERSRALFVELGVAPEELNALSAYYHPRLQFLTKVIPTFWLMTDNAAYAPPFDGFILLPHLAVEGAPPFSANQGIMAHEYSHKVFNRLVERGANVPAWNLHDWEIKAANQLRGIDEGVADVFGFLATGDADFIGPSMGDQAELVDRDMRRARVMTAEDVEELLFNEQTDADGNVVVYDPHLLGAFVGSAFWRVGEDLGDHRKVATALLAVQRELSEAIVQQPKYDFSTLEFLDRFVARLSADERGVACSTFKDRFAQLIAVDTAHPLTRCP